MKIVSRLIATLALVALTGSVFAQTVTIGSAVGQKGSQLILEPSFTAGAQEIDLVQFVVSFANPALANFSDVTVTGTCGGTLGTNNQCVISPNKDAFQVIVSNGVSAMPTGTLASITFTIDGAAAVGDIALVASSIVIGRNGVPADPAVPVTDGAITITDGPQPVYASDPTAAAGVTMSGQITNVIAADVIVNNDAGATGSILTYSCTETADTSNVFTLAGQTLNVDVPVGGSGTVSIGCDSSTIGMYTGEMQCTHNGGVSPSTYALSCNVSAGPEPAYTGVAAGLTMAASQEGDADPMGSLTITNTGDPSTTLTGTCSLTGPDAQITLTGGGFSVAQGAAGAVVAVACDASAEGDYTNTLSCAHNGTNVATPVTYPVTCSVGPAGAAIYSSTPAAGSTIEMTMEDVPVGSDVADQVLTINNAATDPLDNDLIVSGCAYTGDAAITVGAAPTSPIAPLGSSSTTFSCDTAAVGDYTGTYACDYSVDGGTTTTSASYPVHCGVRTAGSELDVTPAPDTTINVVVPINGSNAAIITVSEVLDEGVDATIDSCTLTVGADFAITTVFPLTVPAGGSAMIEIVGTDPADGTLSSLDTLTCTGTDSDGTETAEWELQLTILTAAIPTLSTWGLLAMFLTMLGFGGIMIRRREERS